MLLLRLACLALPVINKKIMEINKFLQELSYLYAVAHNSLKISKKKCYGITKLVLSTYIMATRECKEYPSMLLSFSQRSDDKGFARTKASLVHHGKQPFIFKKCQHDFKLLIYQPGIQDNNEALSVFMGCYGYCF